MSLNIHVADTIGVKADTLKRVIASAEAMQSQESFNTSLRNVLDLFIRTGNVIKTSIFRFKRPLRRAELEKYVQDHTLIVKSIENLNYFDVAELGADTPSGMKGKYIDAVKLINDTFRQLDAPVMLDLTYNSFNQIRTAVLRGEDIQNKADDLLSTLNVKKEFVKKATEQMDKVFTTINRKAKFKDLFASMEEFRDTRALAIDTEKYLDQADGLAKTAANLSSLVSDITAIRDVKISKELTNSLAESASITAKILDLYGTCSANMMSVSHNLTLVFNAMYTKVK